MSSNLEHVCGVAGIHQQHKGRNLRGTMREFSFSSTAIQSRKVFWFLYWLPPRLEIYQKFYTTGFLGKQFTQNYTAAGRDKFQVRLPQSFSQLRGLIKSLNWQCSDLNHWIAKDLQGIRPID